MNKYKIVAKSNIDPKKKSSNHTTVYSLDEARKIAEGMKQRYGNKYTITIYEEISTYKKVEECN